MPSIAAPLRSRGHEAVEIGDFDALADADLAIVVNPNNPDGRIVIARKTARPCRTLRAGRAGCWSSTRPSWMSARAKNRYAAMSGRAALSCCAPSANSLGWPGYGSALPSHRKISQERLDAEFGPWAVAGPALEYGIRALGDAAWQNAMRQTAGQTRRPARCAASPVRHRGRWRHEPVSPCHHAGRAGAVSGAGRTAASSCAILPGGRTSCASACRAAKRNGRGSNRRSRHGREAQGIAARAGALR